MRRVLSRIWKALVAGATSGLGAVGIDVAQLANLEWWQPIILAALTGFFTYWAPSNQPGTLTHGPVEDGVN